ncbi:DUF397 domain-containing protein [Nocardia sp. CA2R105]|uniref:DUF397 domain-containing protein n=1 Tax=Nocardia coffeae TaxID=2873381 RepID=UPI001CA7B37D|nr:DUF397 domain-containing protein [Nocardia coffeae]MBY8855489.1 DUF397 domain-containing protein [Nocardia coffeae]
MTYDLSQAHWFKSSRSKESTACVEIAHLDADTVGVRDSKNPTGPALVFDSQEWDAFNAKVQHGGFDNA